MSDQPPAEHVEPYVNYYDYAPESAVRVDGEWADVTEAGSGILVVGLDQPVHPQTLRATVLEVLDTEGTLLRQADDAILQRHPQTIRGRWCRLPERPGDDGAGPALDAAVAIDSSLAVSAPQPVGGGHELDVTGVVFTDNLQPGVDSDAWMFIVRGHGPPPHTGGVRRRGGGRTTPPRARVAPYLARAYRAGRSDIADRVPNLAPLRQKKVLVIGAGGLGAPSAIEFAKAGVGTLWLVEFDAVEPGNAPRWPLGYQAIGQHKLGAVGNLIRSQWPYTQVELSSWRIGMVRGGDEVPPEWEALAVMTNEVDLLFDATAEVGVNYYLSELAKDLGVPHIVVSTTEGGWGGRIVRFGPGSDSPCWTCLMHHIEDGTIPPPPADPDAATGTVHPAGCTEPTFTGTGFDVASVALSGVRLAVATLCGGEADAYPPANWDLANLEFRSADEALPASSTTYELRQHPNCEPCRLRRSG